MTLIWMSQPLPPESWHYRLAPPSLLCFVLFLTSPATWSEWQSPVHQILAPDGDIGASWRTCICMSLKSLEMKESIRDWTMRFKTKPASVMPALTMEGDVDRIHQQLIRPASIQPQVWATLGMSKQGTSAALFVLPEWTRSRNQTSTHPLSAGTWKARKKVEVENGFSNLDPWKFNRKQERAAMAWARYLAYVAFVRSPKF